MVLTVDLFNIFKGAFFRVEESCQKILNTKGSTMRFLLTMTTAVSLTLFAMNVATSTSTTVDLLKSHTQSTNDFLASLERN
jgi:hypothetical protein